MCTINCCRLHFKKHHFIMLITWQLSLTAGIQMLLPIFYNFQPFWACKSDDSPDFWSKNCSVLESCPENNVTFKYPFYSMVLDFDMLCGPDTYNAALISTFLFLGVLIGAILFGQLSDMFGRKKVSLLLFIGLTIFGCSCALTNSWVPLAVLRFICGMFVGGDLTVNFAYALELIPPEQRLFLRGFFNWGWARMIGTLICFLIPHWRYASIGLSLVCVPAIILIAFFVPESPKWSESKGRIAEMNRSLKWIAKFNGDPPPSLENQQMTNVSSQAEESSEKKKVYTLKDLFATRHMRIQTITLMIMWFAASLSSYANDLNSRNLAGNFWVNQFLFSFLIGLSKPLLFFLDTFVPQFSRRYLHQIPQLLVVVCYVLIIILLSFKLSSTGVIVVNLIGTFLIEYTWDACYVCAAEGFPTVVRTLGIGTCSLMARIGGILAPQMTYLANLWLPAPFATVAVIGFVSLLVSWRFLPDTKGMELAGDIPDEEKKAGEKTESGEVDAEAGQLLKKE